MCKIRLSYKATKKARDFRDTNKKARRLNCPAGRDHANRI